MDLIKEVDPAVWVALIMAGGAMIGSLWTGISASGASRAGISQAADDVAAAFQKLADEYRGQIDVLKAKISELEALRLADSQRIAALEAKDAQMEGILEHKDWQIRVLLNGVRLLLQQLKHNDLEPDWSPEELKGFSRPTDMGGRDAGQSA